MQLRRWAPRALLASCRSLRLFDRAAPCGLDEPEPAQGERPPSRPDVRDRILDTIRGETRGLPLPTNRASPQSPARGTWPPGALERGTAAPSLDECGEP